MPSVAALVRRAVDAARAALPHGRSLPTDVWRRRHRGLTLVLWAHVPLLAAWALHAGGSTAHLVAEAAPVALLAALAGLEDLGRRARSLLTTLGLLTCSALLVHLSGGVIELHFHFFVVVGLVTLYEDWLAYLATVGYVLVHHGGLGAVAPEAVFNHPAAVEQPLLWAAVHGAFVLAASGAGLVRWRAGEMLRAHAARVLDATGEGVCGLDLDGRITFANAAAGRLLGCDPDHLLGRSHHDVARHALVGAPPFPPDECVTCAVAAAGDGVLGRDHVFARADGSAFPVELRCHPIIERGERLGTVVSFRDLSQQVELARRAYHDPLTGLPNRGLLEDRLEQALARRRRDGAVVACLFLDLDGFKQVNDELGHDAGDRLLVEVAERCRQAVRPGDTVARLGGDEFVVVCDGVAGVDEAGLVARRLLEAVALPTEVGGAVVSVTPSIGVATAGRGAVPADVLHTADAAMYRAKASGRGRVVAAPGVVGDAPTLVPSHRAQ